MNSLPHSMETRQISWLNIFSGYNYLRIIILFPFPIDNIQLAINHDSSWFFRSNKYMYINWPFPFFFHIHSFRRYICMIIYLPVYAYITHCNSHALPMPWTELPGYPVDFTKKTIAWHKSLVLINLQQSTRLPGLYVIDVRNITQGFLYHTLENWEILVVMQLI